MTTDEIIGKLHRLVDAGLWNHKELGILDAAAERLFELEERIAIMSEEDILEDETFDSVAMEEAEPSGN